MVEQEIILTKEERLKLIKKIDDSLAMELYTLGLSDEKIAKKFGMSRGCVYQWRKKRGLIANHYRPDGQPNLTEEELKERHHLDVKKRIKFILKKQKEEPEKHREYIKRISQIPRHRNRIIKYFHKLNSTLERKEYKRNWNNKPINKQKRTKYMAIYLKEYYQRPEVKAHKKEYQKIYNQSEKYKAYKKEYQKIYNQSEKYKAYCKAYYQRKKEEKLKC